MPKKKDKKLPNKKQEKKVTVIDQTQKQEKKVTVIDQTEKQEKALDRCALCGRKLPKPKVLTDKQRAKKEALFFKLEDELKEDDRRREIKEKSKAQTKNEEVEEVEEVEQDEEVDEVDEDEDYISREVIEDEDEDYENDSDDEDYEEDYEEV